MLYSSFNVKSLIFIFSILSFGNIPLNTKNDPPINLKPKILNIIEKIKSNTKEAIAQINSLIEKSYEFSQKNRVISIEILKEALKISQSISNHELVAKCSKILGFLYFHNRNHKLSLKELSRAKKYYDKHRNWRESAIILRFLGDNYRFLVNLEKASHYYRLSLSKYPSTKPDMNYAWVCYYLGLIYDLKAEFGNAYKFLQLSMQQYHSLNQKEDELLCKIRLGKIHMQLSQYDKAMKHLLEALPYFRDHNLKIQMAGIYQDVGIIFKDWNNEYDKAVKNFLIALSIYKQIKFNTGIVETNSILADLYFTMKKYNMAYSTHKKALDSIKSVKNPAIVSDIINRTIPTYIHFKNFSAAFELLDDCLKVCKEHNLNKRTAYTFKNLGKVYQGQHRYSLALRHYKLGLNVAKKIKTKDIVKDCYNLLSVLNAKIGNYKTSLEYHRLFHETDKQIFNERSSNRVAILQEEYNLELKEKEIASLIKDKKIKEVTISQQNLVRNVLILCSLIMLTLLFFLFRKYLYLFKFWKKEKYIGKFRLLEKIASGGMGVLYKAHSILDKSEIAAIKILKEELFQDDTHKKRFLHEGNIIDQLDHPHIVKIIERGEIKHKMFIAMEYLEGKTLEELINESAPFDLKLGLFIFRQILDGVKTIHEKNIIHRDLKPANIMLIKKGQERHYVKILDFGLAKMSHQTKITQTGILLGTISYIAPEQILSNVFSKAGDIYSLGVILFEIVTGKKPFEGDTKNSIINKILNDITPEPSKFRKDIPKSLNDIIMQMLAKKTSARPDIKKVIEKIQNMEVL